MLHKIEKPSYKAICCAAGEPGVHIFGHFHSGVLPEDNSIRIVISRRCIFAELLEHTGLCHRVHGVR